MRRRKGIPLDHPEFDLPELRSLWQTGGLFSDHYLKTRIQKNDWWPSDEQVRPIWDFCRELFDKRYVACAKNNEAFTRQELLNPILEKLGFAWSDNLSLPNRDAEPDYTLFSSAADKEAVIEKSREKRYQAAAGILEAKKVNHPLSQLSKHQQRYPHQQIREYLQEAQVLNWGILTNGNEWRLYCRDTKPREFFAVDFAFAIRTLENFKYFHALFNSSALVRDAQGKCRLDRIREQSTDAQTELEEDLRLRVFQLVEILANGFVERPENAIADADFQRLYNQCLIFLYRLLFILYAEGRNLLPVEPRRKYYKDLSLARLLAPLRNFSEYDSPTRTRLHEDILELCRLINGTDPAKNTEYSVPLYNGGLFDPDRHPDLERWRISDAALAEVLRGLLFNPPPDPRQASLPIQTVDYADLRVQQLGSIYEGLLEHHFERGSTGRIVLKTDKAERKATGAYYTPDYIVKYIVEHTVGPLLEEITQRPDMQAGKPNAFADAVLALNILDPAMGSGHFLVEATAYLADHIVMHPTTRPQNENAKDEDEIAYWRRRVVEACIYGVDLNPLAVELAKLSLWLVTIATDSPLNFLDHHLRCGNSLIGARLDQLSCLPKKGRARPTGAPEQVEFAFGPNLKRAVAEVIREIYRIEGQSSGTVATVKDKEKRWSERILPKLAPYKAVADLWTATHFGHALDEDAYIAAAQRILEKVPANGAPGGRALPLAWHTTAESRRFFHWELEFPEVFFAEDGTPKDNPGFDAVIGNPPYENAWAMTGLDDTGRTAIIACCQYPEILTGHWDLYVPFFSRALAILRQGGFQSFILPDSVAREKYAIVMRQQIIRDTTLNRWTHFEEENVFVEVSRHCVIYSLRKGPPADSHEVDCAIPPTPDGRSHVGYRVPQKDWLVGPAQQFRPQGMIGIGAKLRKCIEDQSIRIGQFCYVMVGATVHSKDTVSFTKADVVTANRKGNAKRFFDGKTLARYEIRWDGRYLDYRRNEMYGPRVPQLFEGPKITVRDVTEKNERLVAAYDDTGMYCDHLVTCITPYEQVEGTGVQTDFSDFPRLKTDKPSLLFTTALVASTLMTWYFREVFATGTLQGSYSTHIQNRFALFPSAGSPSPRRPQRVSARPSAGRHCTRRRWGGQMRRRWLRSPRRS